MEKIDIDIIQSDIKSCFTLGELISDLLESIETIKMQYSNSVVSDRVVAFELERTLPQLRVVSNTLQEKLDQGVFDLGELINNS